VDKMAVREWLHANHRCLVKVKFGPEAAIHTVDRKGEKLRTVNFRTSEALTVEESQVSTLTSHNSMRCVAHTGDSHRSVKSRQEEGVNESVCEMS
jgi:hypothetical protein